MTSKTIDIDEKIYIKLIEKRKEKESISDVIERLLGEKKDRKDIKRAIGLWKDIPGEIKNIIESANEELRQEINQRFQ
ncbi:MAG: antitoxin VapB family protein [Promethearchaeota archaeon]